jgi:ATP-dependent Lon protease
MESAIYGHEEAKLQIMQFVSSWIANPKANGNVLSIHGPPGTGKTSLIKDGVAKALERPFHFITLGGATDASFLDGHSYTYEGSTWGKIADVLMQSKYMNPIIYFDELDKVSETPKGEEIIGVLTHLTDTTQNMQFHDKYFSEIREFDLSKCLFIFSYNDESKINPILLNRMYVIQTKGYDTKEKMVIARKYLLPKISQQVRNKPEDIVLSDDILNHIITDTRLTLKEDGVRNLKRCLEIIYTKLNLYRVMSKGNAFFQKYKDIPKDIEFPVEITRQHLNLLIKNNESLLPTYLAMYN